MLDLRPQQLRPMLALLAEEGHLEPASDRPWRTLTVRGRRANYLVFPGYSDHLRIRQVLAGLLYDRRESGRSRVSVLHVDF